MYEIEGIQKIKRSIFSKSLGQEKQVENLLEQYTLEE